MAKLNCDENQDTLSKPIEEIYDMIIAPNIIVSQGLGTDNMTAILINFSNNEILNNDNLREEIQKAKADLISRNTVFIPYFSSTEYAEL